MTIGAVMHDDVGLAGTVLRTHVLASCTLPLLLLAVPTTAQAIDTHTDPPPMPAGNNDQIEFSADTLEYDTNTDIVTATGAVRMTRDGQRLRADKVVWNRKTGRVEASGDVAVTNPRGEIAYGDRIELTDSLRDGVVGNLLVVLNQGARLAARKGSREEDGTLNLNYAAYTPCSVVTSAGCPKNPSWEITAVRVTYRPERRRIYFRGARFNLFGLPGLPLPNLSAPVGGEGGSGLLTPQFRVSRTNGLQVALPYHFTLGPNRSLTITPNLFTNVLPMLAADYRALSDSGAFSLTGYLTDGRRSDTLSSRPVGTQRAIRGYLDGIARYQLTPNWSVSGSLRVTTDKTFLRRYDISRDDRLRNTASLQRIDADSYFSLSGWAVQTLRVDDVQGMQPIALPEIDYRRRMTDPWLGGTFLLQLNSLALTRSEGQDTQRAFASLRWDLRRLTTLGQEVTFTAFGRADAYNANDVMATAVSSYRGTEGFSGRAIGALAADVKWPLVGDFLGGTQRLTPRLQVVASPKIANLRIPNEDSRAVDLQTSNLFALNRFPGYDRFEDSSRITYGGEWAIALPGLALDTVIGQSYRLDRRPSIFFPGTGLSDRFSDFVGRTDARYRDFVALSWRYRIDKSSFAIRRNEIDATIGSQSTYALLGYIKLNRNIMPAIEDLADREEARAAVRVQFTRFWSAFGSAVIDLTNRDEDPLSTSDGFSPVKHRLGVQYEDDCLRLGFTWRRDYRTTGDARAGNNFRLSLSLKNLGR